MKKNMGWKGKTLDEKKLSILGGTSVWGDGDSRPDGANGFWELDMRNRHRKARQQNGGSFRFPVWEKWSKRFIWEQHIGKICKRFPCPSKSCVGVHIFCFSTFVCPFVAWWIPLRADPRIQEWVQELDIHFSSSTYSVMSIFAWDSQILQAIMHMM